jgi:hypothetical protein
VTFDGVNDQSSNYGTTNPHQPPSSTEEMKIQVSGMNAEFGYGVASVNVITKSGSNKFHGEAYEFLRNNTLDSNYYFANLAGRRRAPYHQNQFVAAAGGPVVPNRLFFFAAYEGLRVRQSTFTIETVPTADLRSGNFAGMPTVFNPLSYSSANGLRQPFSGNRIPVSAMDPVTYKFLQTYVPLPNTVNQRCVATGGRHQPAAGFGPGRNPHRLHEIGKHTHLRTLQPAELADHRYGLAVARGADAERSRPGGRCALDAGAVAQHGQRRFRWVLQTKLVLRPRSKRSRCRQRSGTDQHFEPERRAFVHRHRIHPESVADFHLDRHG